MSMNEFRRLEPIIYQSITQEAFLSTATPQETPVDQSPAPAQIESTS